MDDIWYMNTYPKIVTWYNEKWNKLWLYNARIAQMIFVCYAKVVGHDDS